MASFNKNGAPKKEYPVFNFSGGLNTTDANTILKDEEARDLLNVQFGERGSFRKRPGVKQNEMYPKIEGYLVSLFYDWYPRGADSGQFMVYSNDSDFLFRFNGIDMEFQNEDLTVYTPDETPFLFEWLDRLYVMFSKKGVFKFNSIESRLENVAVFKEVPAMPKGTHAVIKNERAFITGDPDNPDYVYYSQIMDVEMYSQYVDDHVHGAVATSQGGGGIIRVPGNLPVTGLTVFQDCLVMFQEKGAFRLTGKIYEDWTFETIDVADGCLDFRSIAQGNNVVYYLSPNGVRYLTTPFQTRVETLSLSDSVKSLVNGKCQGSIYDKGKYYLFLQDYTLVFNVDFMAWTKWDIKARAVCDKNVSFSSLDGSVCEFHDGQLYDEYTTGNKTPINAYYKTPYYSFKAPEYIKRYRLIKLFFEPNEIKDSVIDIAVEVDYKGSFRSVDAEYITMKWGEGVWGESYWGEKKQQISQSVRFGGSGETVSFTFKNDKLDEELEIFGFVCVYKEKTRIR